MNLDNAHCLDFDEFLPYIGEFGFYQKRLIVYFLPYCFLYAFIYLTQIFIILVPRDHWCRIPALEALTKEEQLKLAIPKDKKQDFDRCNMYDVDYTALLESKITTANDSWHQIPCRDGWIYDREQVPYESIAMEYDWVCENNKLGTYTVTIYFLGAIVGCLCFGYVSDHCGRVPALMTSNLCALVGGVLCAVCKDFYGFAATRFVVGLSFDSCFMPMYILCEFLSCSTGTFSRTFTEWSTF